MEMPALGEEDVKNVIHTGVNWVIFHVIPAAETFKYIAYEVL